MNIAAVESNVDADLLRQVVEAMPAGVVVFDSAGTIVLVNREAERLFQFSAEELVGRLVESLLPERFRNHRPEWRTQLLADPHSVTVGSDRELFGLRKDGREFPLEIGLHPLETLHGMFVLGIVVDISRRQRIAEDISRSQRLAALNLAQDAQEARQRAEVSEERLNLALSSSGVGTWSWDVAADSIHWDDFLHPLFGRRPGTFSGRYEDFLGMVLPDDRERVTREVRQSLDGHARYDSEFQVVWPDGSLHALASRGKVYRDEQGRAVRMTGVCWDVTERKESERALAAANAQLAGVLDAATQVSIIATDVNGLITIFNSGAQQLLGYSAGDMIGRQTPEVIHLREEVVARGEELSRELGRPVAGFEVFVAYARLGRFDRREWTYVRKDGSRFPVNLVVTAVSNPQGEITGFLGVAEDVTEHKRSEERLRSIVEAAPTAMALVNAAGEIVLVNHRLEEVFGYRRRELIGRKMTLLLPERFRAQDFVRRQESSAAPAPRVIGDECELSGLRQDGTEFPLRIGLSPIETDEGSAMIWGVVDITTQKIALETLRQAKEAAESASRAKSSFLANMSHEIRTPMNGIIGMSQLLAQTELRSHQRDYLATIEESAHTLLRILNDILDFSKIEAGKLELESSAFRLSDCVARAAHMLLLRAAEKGLELACRVAPDCPDYLRGDPGRLQQVLVNLLGNAVKFTDDGEIFVNVNVDSLQPDRARLHFSVSDTGIGISPEKLSQIFRPFVQAEASTTRRFGGTGLGLAISQQLVEMMHGRIWVDSDVGRGSTFHFTAEFDVVADQHRRQPAELETLRDLPVLVVDDNLTNRRILKEMLENWRMQPALASSAAAARQALAAAEAMRRPIRLILLDHHMPDEDGFQFARSLPDDGAREQCPIIMISSGASPVDAEAFQKYGIRRFMTKPVIASELLNEILQQFGQHADSREDDRRSAAAASAPVQPRRVLLVEDNLINRQVAVGMLRSRGHQIVHAENGQQAVDLLATQDFDVILMDMQMPVMDGYEATRVIRAREQQAGGHIPIVAMTAEALKGDRERCLAAGMDDYVAKPISAHEMYRAVEQYPALCLPADAQLPEAVDETSAAAPPSAPPQPLPQPPAGSSLPPGIDWSVARSRLGDQMGLLPELSDLMKSQAPTLLADIRRSIETGDSKLLRRSAHTLKGSATYFGAEPLVQAALALEQLGRDESFDGVAGKLATFEHELARALAELEAGPPAPAA